MARRRQSGPVVDESAEIVAFYERRLSQPAELPGFEWQPVTVGPSWRIEGGRWVLPERTLGWQVLAWCGRFLQHRGDPWVFTDEQARIVLWWYAVDESGAWLFRDGVVQRLKGWGKDPLAACLAAVEAFGPARVRDMAAGRPVGGPCEDGWVQVAAVALEQTKTTFRFFPGLFTEAAKAEFRLQLGKETIYGLGDTRLIQAVTSSPTTLEGARATMVVLNETHHWKQGNAGHDMADVIERNASKSEGGAARTLRFTNAYEPGEDSVAQRDREAWEQVAAGRAEDVGLMYDSLEAPPDAPLSLEEAPAVLETVRGDSVWLDVDTIVKSIADVRNPPSRSRRFWYNQITATEDAWLAPYEWDARAEPGHTVPDGALVTLGFDGSKTDDHSALVGCEVESGHLFEVEVWEPSQSTGEVDRLAIDRRVRECFDRFDVVGFYSDLHPFESYVDQWAEDFGQGLVVKASPHQPVAWDIRARGFQFTSAVERLHDAVLEGAVTHCGSARFRQHVHNARNAPNKWGMSVRKEARESARKIDAVPAAVLARLARQDYLALPEHRRRKKARTNRAVFV